MSRVYIPATLRHFIVVRANGLCEYCLLHQDDTPLTHPIDHVIALKHGGPTSEENLALSCLDCNLNKGSDLTTFDPLTGELVRLFDPRTQEWEEYFTIEAARIVGLTPVGRATVRLLHLNTPQRLIQRQILQEVGRYPYARR